MPFVSKLSNVLHSATQSLKRMNISMLPRFISRLLPQSLQDKTQTLVSNSLELLITQLLSKSLNLGLSVRSVPSQPLLAAVQLVALTLKSEASEPLPEKLTSAAKIVYAQLPSAWKEPAGPLSESELLAVLRDGLRLSRSIQSITR